MSEVFALLDTLFAQRLGWTLLHFLWQGTAIGLLTSVVLAGLRRSRSELRHRVLIFAFGVLAITPLVTLALVSPIEQPLTNRSLPEPGSGPEGTFAVSEEFPADQPVAPRLPLVPLAPEVSLNEQALETPAVVVTAHSSPPGRAVPLQQSTWTLRLVTWFPWLVGLWGAGVGLLTLRLGGQWWRLRRLVTQQVQPLQNSWATLTAQLVDAFEIGRRVQFLESQLAQVPLVIGWLRPVVIVPTAVLTHLTPLQVEALLTHELVHLKRWDDVVNLLQTMLETLLFYHPAVWWISARLREERENCCDDLAVELIGDRMRYSRALVAAAELVLQQQPIPLALAATDGELSKRIRRLLGVATTGQPRTLWPVVILGSLLLLMVTVLVACSTRESAADSASLAADSQSTVQTFLKSEESLHRIAGQILGGAGQPLGGVRVLLHEAPVSYPSPSPAETRDIAETTTTADGRFEFRNVPIEANVYWADRGRRFDVIALPQANSGLAMTWGRVADDSDVVLRLATGATLSGRVTNLIGAPVANATLQLRHVMSVRHLTQGDLEDGRWPRMDDQSFLSLQNSDQAPLAKTDADGNFALPGLPQNAGFMVDVLAQDHIPQIAYAATVAQLDTLSQQRLKRPVQVGKLAVQLDPGQRVIVDVVYEDTGEPVKGATRPLLPQGYRNQHSYKEWHVENEVAANGTFTLTAVPSGPFSLSVYAPGHEGKRPKYKAGSLETILSGEAPEQRFKLIVPINNLVPIELNTVLQGTDEPFPNADVSFREAVLEPGPMHGVQTDPQGRYELLAEPGKKLRFFVRDPGRAAMQIRELTPVNPAGEQLTFELQPDPIYRGIVLDPAGKPVPEVAISYRVRSGENGTFTASAKTDVAGRFELTGLFKDFYYMHDRPITEPTSAVFFDHQGHAGAVVALPLPGPEFREQIVVQLQSAQPVTGQVLEADSGRPLAGVRVSLARLDQTAHGGFFQGLGEHVETDAEGRFRILGALPGETHELFVGKDGYEVNEEAVTSFQLAKSEPQEVEAIVLRPQRPQRPVWPILVPDVRNLEPQQALETLLAAHQQSVTAFQQHLQDAGQEHYRQPGDGVWQFSREVWKLAAADRDSELAFSACLWIVGTEGFPGVYDVRHSEVRRTAAKLLFEHFVDRAGLQPVVYGLVHARFAGDDGRPLNPLVLGEMLVAKNPHREVQATALYEAARWLTDTRGGHATITPEQRTAAISVLQRIVKDYGEIEIYAGTTYADRARSMLAVLSIPATATDAGSPPAVPANAEVAPRKWTPAELLAGIEAILPKYNSVAYRREVREEYDVNYFTGGEPTWNERTARYTFRTDGVRWFAEEENIVPATATKPLRMTRTFSGFDGTAHYEWTGIALLIGQDTVANRRHHPAALFWSLGRDRSWLTKSLSVPEAKVVGEEVVDGFTCVRVTSHWNMNDAGEPLNFELLISPQQGFLPLRSVITRANQPKTERQLTGVRQDPESQLWYPLSISDRIEPATEHVRRRLMVISEFKGNPQFADPDMARQDPGAVDILDFSTGAAYFNDPWWPELRDYLSQTHQYPAPWLWPTDQLMSYAEPAMHGQVAPQIRAQRWINGDPGEWSRPDRKWTILHFFGGGLVTPTPEQICSLQALVKKYAATGIDLVGVVPDDQGATAEQLVAELRLKFPVAVAAASEQSGSFGLPHDDYQLKTYGGTFLVSPDGHLHFMNNAAAGEVAALPLEPLLQNLMALDQQQYARPDGGLDIDQWRATIREWERLRNTSPATGSIEGQVQFSNIATKRLTDFSRVVVQVVPYFSLVNGHIVTSHTTHEEANERQETQCDASGHFSIGGLRKGTYKLRVTGPQIVAHEEYVTIPAAEFSRKLDVGVEWSE